MATQKKLLPRLALALLTTLLSLGAAEVGLRLYFGGGIENAQDLRDRLELSRKAALGESMSLFGLVQASEYEDIVYQLKPNLDGYFRDQPIHTNSIGIRGHEYALEKPAGTIRVVGLGDSHMFGWGVAQDEVYLHRVEVQLNAAAPGRRFEVMNFGVPGYNTTMEVATLEHRALAYDPDLVVIHFVGNDYGLPHFMQPPVKRGVDPRTWYLVSLLKALLGPPSEDQDSDLLPHDRSHHEVEYRHETRQQYDYMVGPDAYREAMQKLVELTRLRGIPVILFVYGIQGDNRVLALEAAERHDLPIVNPGPRMLEVMRERGLPSNRKNRRDLFQIPNDGHPTALAHQIYAEVLAEAILERFPGE